MMTPEPSLAQNVKITRTGRREDQHFLEAGEGAGSRLSASAQTALTVGRQGGGAGCSQMTPQVCPTPDNLFLKD